MTYVMSGCSPESSRKGNGFSNDGIAAKLPRPDYESDGAGGDGRDILAGLTEGKSLDGLPACQFRFRSNAPLQGSYADDLSPVVHFDLKLYDTSQFLLRNRRCGPCIPYPTGQVKDRKSTRLNSSHVKISYAVF